MTIDLLESVLELFLDWLVFFLCGMVSIALCCPEAVAGEWGVVEFVERPVSLINIHTIYIYEIATLIEFLIKLLGAGKSRGFLIVKRTFRGVGLCHYFRVFALFKYSSYRYLLVIPDVAAARKRSLLV